MKRRWMYYSLLMLLVAGLLVLGGCAPENLGTPTAAPPQASQEEPAAAPTEEPVTPSQAQAPDQAPAAIPTEDLIAQVEAALPADAYGGLSVLPLIVPEGSRPLWAVVSTGMRNFELEPLPSHFIALYTYTEDGWQELARLDLDSQDQGGPDYVDETSTQQVQLDPDRIWLEVAGGMGAHGGSYQVLSYDGTTLKFEVNAMSPSPGMGSVRDVNGDGKFEVVLDVTDPYILCYACGARKTQFQVLAWDAQQGKLVEVALQPVEGSEAANRAVELAKAGLWKAALARIEEARQTGPAGPALEWDYGLIKLHTDAMTAQPLTVEPDVSPVVPLLNNVFYGDYAAAVDILRAYKPEELFSDQSPLTTDEMIANFVPDVSKRLTESASQALSAEPDLAAAHFIKGWGEYLADPAGPQAGEDIARAAALAPEDTLYSGSVAALQ